jgi:hypothetical protein
VSALPAVLFTSSYSALFSRDWTMGMGKQERAGRLQAGRRGERVCMVGIIVRGVIFRFVVWRALRGLVTPLFLLYGVVGLAAARSHHYFAHVTAMRSIVAALLAVLLWPLVLLGIDLHLG